MSKEKSKPSKKSFVSFQAEDKLQGDFDEVAKKYGLTRSFVLRQLMKLYIKENEDMKLIVHEEK